MPTKKKSTLINESIISMVLGSLVVLMIGILVYNYFTKLNPEKNQSTNEKTGLTNLTLTPSAESETNQVSPKKYVIVDNDYLWKIAEQFYQDGYKWVEIANENKINNPDLIYPKQEIILPKIEKVEGSINSEGVKTVGKTAITTDQYTVVAGDSLWNISIRACGDGFKWQNIARLNNLVNPDLIHPGNLLEIICQ